MTQLALPTMEEAPGWWRTVPDRTGLAAYTVESGVLEYCPVAPIRFRLCAGGPGGDP